MNKVYDSMFWFSVLLLAIYWIRLLRKRPLGASHIFIGLVLFFHGPALIFYRDIWAGDFGFGLLSSLNNPEVTGVNVVLGMSVCFMSLLAGMLFAEKIVFRPLVRTDKRLQDWMCGSGIIRLRRSIVFFIIFVIAVLVVQYIFIAGPKTIYDYYISDVTDFDRFRIRRESNIDFYPYGVLIGTLVPFVSFVLLAEVVKSKQKKLMPLLFVSVFIIFLAKFSQYTKAGPTLYFLQLLFCAILAGRKTFFVGKNEVVFVLISLAAITSMVTFVGEGVELAVVFDRLLMIPNEVIFEYFAAIPDSYPFGYGRGVSVIRYFFGDAIGSMESLPVHMHVAAVTRGEYGTIVNGFFISDAWAEFGWLGIPILSFVGGILVGWYDYRLSMVRHSSVRAAMVTFSLSGCYSLVTSAFTTSLLTGGMMLVPIFVAWLEQRTKIYKNSPCASSKISLPTSPT